MHDSLHPPLFTLLSSLFTLLSSLFTTTATAQQPAFRHFTVNDGLPGSMVYAPYQSSDGYIWLPTDMGLVRYDGYTFRTFSVKDGLPYNDVWDAQEDREGRIWLTTFGRKYVYFDPKTQKINTIDGPLPAAADSKQSLLYFPESPYGECFLEQGKYILSLNANGDLALADSLKWGYAGNAGAFQKFNERNGILYSHENKTLFNCKTGAYTAWENLPDTKTIPAGADVYWDKNGGIKMAATEDSIFVRQADGFERLANPLKSAWSSTHLLAIHDGLYVFRGKNGMVFTDSLLRPLPSYAALQDWAAMFPNNGIVIDRSNNFWFNTLSDGAYFLSAAARASNTYVAGGRFQESHLTSIARDNKGRVWAASKNAGLAILDGKGIQLVRPYQQLLDLKPRLRLDKEGQFWLSADKLYRFRPESPTALAEMSGGVKDFYLGKDRVWLAMPSGVSSIQYNGAKGESFPIGRSYAVAEDQNGNVWVGQPAGLCVIQNGQRVEYLKREKNTNQVLGRNIKCLAVDSKNRLWAGTEGYGLFAWHNNNAFPIKELMGLTVKSLQISPEDKIVASTNQGVWIIGLLGGGGFKYTVRLVDAASGLPGNETNEALLTRDTLYVASSGGLSVVDLSELAPVRETPPLFLRQVTIRGQDTLALPEYRLSWWQNSLSLEYVCLSYQSAGNIGYRYKMEGLDTTWHLTRSLRVDFPYLPAGEYRFCLHAIDGDGNQSQELYVSIIISPPFWGRWWFWGLVALGLLGGGYVILKRRR